MPRLAKLRQFPRLEREMSLRFELCNERLFQFEELCGVHSGCDSQKRRSKVPGAVILSSICVWEACFEAGRGQLHEMLPRHYACYPQHSGALAARHVRAFFSLRTLETAASKHFAAVATP